MANRKRRVDYKERLVDMKSRGLLLSKIDEPILLTGAFNIYVMTGGKQYVQGGSFDVGADRKRPKTLHRLIMERVLKRPMTKEEYVDHKNGNTLDNRRSNLRVVSADENRHNRITRKDSVTGLRGVHWNPRQCNFRSIMFLPGKGNRTQYHQNFDDPLDAYLDAIRIRKEKQSGYIAPKKIDLAKIEALRLMRKEALLKKTEESNTRLTARNTSGYRWVHWAKHANKWGAKRFIDGQQVHIGYFDDPKEAYLAALNEPIYSQLH